MAHKRMFSMDIVDSDAFLTLPASSQLLYFHLGMRADDDGFIGNARSIQRMIGAADGDMKVLFEKRFLLMFESGVIVVKHWRINNTLRNDRYHPTRYVDEKRKIRLKNNGSYTEQNQLGIPDGNQMATEKSIGEYRKEEKKSFSNEKGNTNSMQSIGESLRRRGKI